ncbi:MAG: hypothetical protein QF416_09280, partial [Candidatus Marinimicrobia bacterium]|nr:hypothetical protein [Candidatus Neomarinimicrobiota bacterium]
MEGRSFHIYAVGKEYEGEYSQQITWKETKIPRIRFELNAVKPFQLEKSWELCIEEKIKSNQFSCDITASVLPDPSTGQHVIKEPYCSNDPFKIKIENINNFMRRYPELNRGSLPYKELDKRMGNLYSKRRDEEFRLIQEKGIEDKAQFAQGCGNCKLERQEGRTQGGEFDYW